jgi:recombinational DNA repair ATPase RecF
LASYWEKQLQSINELVANARTDFMSAWEEALQAAADAFKSSVEEIVLSFEKSMTGSFNGYAQMQEAYDQ